MIVTAFIAGPVSQEASPARHRNSLAILNQSNATLYVAFDQPAVVGAVAGQLTIGPLNPSGNAVDTPGAVFSGAARGMPSTSSPQPPEPRSPSSNECVKPPHDTIPDL